MSSRRSAATSGAETSDPTAEKSAKKSAEPRPDTPIVPDAGDRTGSIVFAVLAMLIATLTVIPAANLVKEDLSGGSGGTHLVLPVLAAAVAGIAVAAVFAISVRMSGLGSLVIGAVLVAAGVAFLATPGALMNVDAGTGYWHALSTGSSWIALTGGFPAAGAALIGVGVGAHHRRLGRTAGPAAMPVAGVLLAIAGSLLAAYAGTGSAKPAVFMLSAKVGDAALYRRMLFEPHYVTLLAVLGIGLLLLAAAGYFVRWSPWSAVLSGALLEIPVLLMVIRPQWIVSGSESMLHSSGAGTNIGEFILFGGLGLIGVVFLGAGVGTRLVRPPDSAPVGVRDEKPERDVDEELRSGEQTRHDEQ